MGLFSRRNTVAPRPAATDHIIVDSEVLARVHGLIAAFERQAMTGGTRDRMDEAVIAINRAGTRPDSPAWARSDQDYMVRLTEQVSDGNHDGHLRMWTWLASVAEAAAERGDHRLAVRCVHFATWWLLVQTPQMSPAAEMAMRLPGGIPDDACGRLLTVGLRVAPLLPPTELLIDDSPSHKETVSLGDAVRIFAFVARGRTAYLAPDVAALPARILGD